VLSPGSATLQSLAEDDKKFFHAVRYSDDVGYAAKSVPIDNRTVLRVDLSTPVEAEAVMAYLIRETAVSLQRSDLPAHLRRPIWHVKLPVAAMAGFVEALEEAAKDKAHLFLRNTAAAVEAEVSTAANESTFDEALHNELGDDSPLRPLAIRLWKSLDPKEETSLIVAEMLKPPAVGQ
jgi:hypothetical protein